MNQERYDECDLMMFNHGVFVQRDVSQFPGEPRQATWKRE
jgi:hypothetical protein